MRPPRLLAVLGLVVLLAPTLAHAQGSSVTIATGAHSGGQALADASPLAPGQSILVDANVTTTGDNATEHRAFLNATVDGEPAGSTRQTWTGEDTVHLSTRFAAPQETGGHGLSWNVTVQSRDGADQPWSTADTREEAQAFRVEEQLPPPDPSDVEITAGATVNGTALEDVDQVRRGQSIILTGTATVPDRNRTQWRAFFNVTVDGSQTTSKRLVRSGGGAMNLTAMVTAPQKPGTHEVGWTLTVQYRDAGDRDATWSTVKTADETTPFEVEELTVPPQPGLPWGWILAIGAVIVAGGAGAYWWQTRDRQIRGQARSQAMRDLEGESFEEQDTGEPEVHPQLKILQARAEDVKRMIELARERHESGDLTEHQYETIRENKEAELEEIQAEMDEYREQG